MNELRPPAADLPGYERVRLNQPKCQSRGGQKLLLSTQLSREQNLRLINLLKPGRVELHSNGCNRFEDLLQIKGPVSRPPTFGLVLLVWEVMEYPGDVFENTHSTQPGSIYSPDMGTTIAKKQILDSSKCGHGRQRRLISSTSALRDYAVSNQVSRCGCVHRWKV